MTLTIPAGLGPFVEPSAFSTPIFDTVKDIADIKAWGVMWLLATYFAVCVATRGRWWAYVAANAWTLGLSTAWLGAVCWAKFVNDQRLTVTAIGLWLFPMAACIWAITSPTKVSKGS